MSDLACGHQHHRHHHAPSLTHHQRHAQLEPEQHVTHHSNSGNSSPTELHSPNPSVIVNQRATLLSLSGTPAAAIISPACHFHSSGHGSHGNGSNSCATPGYYVMMTNPGSSLSSEAHMPVHGAPGPRKKSNSINVADLSVPSRTSRDERRRATHNEVERRRRDKINNWITKLAKLVPDCNQDHTKQGQSKGGILAKTCDHICDLEQRVGHYRELVKDREFLANEVLTLRDQLSSANSEIRRLRALLARQDQEEEERS